MVVIILVQGGVYFIYVKLLGVVDQLVFEIIFWFFGIIIFLIGIVFVMWLGECIIDCGIGNGVFFLIIVGIIVILLFVFVFELQGCL